MLRQPLLLQHEMNGKIIKTKLLKQAKRPFVIGSSRHADIRVVDDKAAGIHAALEYRHPHWYVIHFDPGLTETEHKLSNNETIEIAGQKIKVFLGQESKAIFKDVDLNTKNFNAHQVVLLANNNVVNTHFLPKDQPYAVSLGQEIKMLEAPKSADWVETTFGTFTIRQRLTYKPNELERPKIAWDLLNDRATRNGLIVAGIFTLMLLIGINLPKSEQEEKPEENKFTQMIFDKNVVKQMQQEAKELTQKRFEEAAPKKIDTSPVPRKQLVTKVVKDIKTVGVTDLVAKISKRASLTALKIEAVGKSPDVLNSSSALAKIGGSKKIAKEVNAAGQNYQLANVKTAGKAGGNSAYAKGTSLNAAGIGTASVDVLEEETIVEGGLDKEVIAEYIRSKLGQIRYCYERQLSGKPDLHGTVLVRFTIGGTGAVVSQSIARTTLKDANVEACILRRVAGWNFPTPKGGTSVVVSYPFLFKSIN